MSNILACFQLLELNVISAQDLAVVGRSMRTYAVAWIDPDRKLSTRVDAHGLNNPSWNDKFVFRVDEDFFYDDTSSINIDIYALHWFRDIHVGTANVLIGDLLPPPPPSRPFHQSTPKTVGMRFVGLQVRRPSGRPKGILNVGVAVLDSSMRSMPLYTHNPSPAGPHHDYHQNQLSHQVQAKPELRRTKSDTSSMIGSEAMARDQRERAKAKKGKPSSVITPSEASSKGRKKASSMLSGSDGKKTPKKGKFGKKNNYMANGSEATISDFNTMQRHATPRMNVSYEVKPSPKPQFRNSPAVAFGGAHKVASARATPLHPLGKVNNGGLEYGTPRRSNLANMGQPIMTDSELGPSPSEVAAAVARQPVVDEGENSTVGGWSLDESLEGVQPKVERWRTELPTVYDNGGEISTMPTSSKSKSKKERHARRHTDGGNGLFSCFSNICGIQCTVVCGGGGGAKKNRRRRSQSADNASFV